MKKHRLRTLAIGCSFALAIAALPLPAFAHEGEDHLGTDDTVMTTKVELETERQNKRGSGESTNADSNRSKRLEQAKLKICEGREKAITNVMSRASNRAQKQLDLFSKITERVEAFYAKQGKPFANYDELVAAVSTAKAQAASDLESLKAVSFDCSADDPKGNATEFKTALTTLNESLKSYRTAVKNLITGVRSAQGQGAEQ